MSDTQFIVECPCGVVVRASTVEGLIPDVQAHASQVHQMQLDHDQVVDMARPA